MSDAMRVSGGASPAPARGGARLSAAMVEARRQAVRWMAQRGGVIEVCLLDDDDPLGAACALHLCLGMAADGLCAHEQLSDATGRFTLLPAGWSLLGVMGNA